MPHLSVEQVNGSLPLPNGHRSTTAGYRLLLYPLYKIYFGPLPVCLQYCRTGGSRGMSPLRSFLALICIAAFAAPNIAAAMEQSADDQAGGALPGRGWIPGHHVWVLRCSNGGRHIVGT